jgi:hypothetical protein
MSTTESCAEAKRRRSAWAAAHDLGDRQLHDELAALAGTARDLGAVLDRLPAGARLTALVHVHDVAQQLHGFTRGLRAGLGGGGAAAAPATGATPTTAGA